MSRSLYKNMAIIGNGCDICQGLTISYEKIRLHYQENIESIAKSINCTHYTVNEKTNVTDMKLIYREQLNPNNLTDVFSGTWKQRCS